MTTKTLIKGVNTVANLLIFGDNVATMEHLLTEGLGGKIDLIYIDPPFATNTVFSVSVGRASTISRATN